MKTLKLLKMGKPNVSGPLNDIALLGCKPWHVLETRKVKDEVAFNLLAKYPKMFQEIKDDELGLAKVKKPKSKLYENKITKPKGVK